MPDQKHRLPPPVAHGMSVFAGVMLIIGGAFQAIEALAAIVNDQYIVVLPSYIYAFDVTVWGWVHLLIGLALAAIIWALISSRQQSKTA